MKITAIGSIAFDTVETPGARAENVLGGSAVYFAFSASFFAEVGIVGVVGEDFSDENIKMLKARGIDTSGVKIRRGKTFKWEGRYSENMNDRETISVCQNVFEGFSPGLPAEYRKSEIVFLGNISPAQQLEVLSQTENPGLAAADTMDLWINSERPELIEVLQKINLLIINDSEAKLLTGENNILGALRKIRRMGPEIIVIKKGENGAVLAKDEKIILSIPAYPLERVVDPTGAGDSFAGGMLGWLAASGKTDEAALKTAVACGSVVASFCVEEFSLEKLKQISGQDIKLRLEEYSRLTRF